VEVSVSQPSIPGDASIALVACSPVQPSHVNCDGIQPCYGRGVGGNLTLAELSTQKIAVGKVQV